MEKPKSEEERDWEEVLADLPKRIREAGDTTASSLADKTDSPLIDKLHAKGYLGRVLIGLVALAVVLFFMVGCTAPGPTIDEPIMACTGGVTSVASAGRVFMVALPCQEIGTYEGIAVE